MESKIFVLISPKNRTAYNFRGDLLREIIKLGYTVYVTGPNRIDVDKIESLGATFVEIPNDKNGINVFSDLRYMWSLYKLFRRLKPSATLGYTVKPVIYGAIAARMAGVKSISSMITGVGYLFISKTLKAKILKQLVLFLYRLGIWCSSRLIFQNDDDRAEFISEGLVSNSKSHVVNGSGVNMSRFSRAPYPEKLTFFMLSRAMYSKGVIEYAEAAKMVKARYPEVQFMFLGAFEGIQDSIPESDFRSQYIDSGILDYYSETSDVPSYIARSSVYVLPSYREGTPRTVLEAMSMGRAIITTDVPGCRGTVKDGVTGYLVEARSPEVVANAMIKFVENPSLVSEMGEQSYEYCYNKYRIDLVNESMISVMSLISYESANQ